MECPSLQVEITTSTSRLRWIISHTENNLVILGENGGNVSAFDGDTGQFVWKFEIEGNGGTPWLCQENGILYATTGSGTVYALVSATGTVKWKQNLDEPISAQPVVDRRGTLYLATNHNTLLAVSTRTGECVWRHYFGWSMTSIPDGDYVSPAIGPNGMVYAASTDHYLYALQRP
jgi:outer membrane protein assembly factor BamB